MKRLGSILVTLAVPWVLLAANIWLLASAPFLRWEYGRAGFPAAAGFGPEERLAAAVPSALFIVRPMDRGRLAALEIRGLTVYTPVEIDHLVDVKRLVTVIGALGCAGALLVVGGLLAWWRRRLPGFPKAMARGGWLMLALVLVVGVGITLAWPLVFTGFHELFFRPGTWQFPVDSGLIRLFPGRFWYDTAVALAGLCAVEALGVILLGRRLRHDIP